MEKLKNLLKSKRFWTLVAAVVAALTAFFTSSCVGYTQLRRSGIHCDTVEFNQFYKSKNFVSCAQTISTSSPISFHSRSFLVKKNMSVPSRCSFVNRFPRRLRSALGSVFRSTTPLISPFAGLLTISQGKDSISYSVVMPPQMNFTSRSTSAPGSALALALTFPAFVSRRGGRRGRPRPKTTKTIPIGGRHL